MARIYDAQSTIELPPMSASSAATLGAQLKAEAATEKKLAPNVAETLADLDVATTTLQASVLGPPEAAGEALVQPALQAEAAVWSGFESWLAGTCKLPADSPWAAIAERLYGALFPDGLVFLRLPVLERWNETQRRIDLLVTRGVAGDLTAIGGTEFAAGLQRTHAAVGAAAGITTARPQAPEVPQKAAALNGFRAALRCYVAQHVANAARDKSGAAAALATRLLSPLADYEPPARARADRAQPEQSAAPETSVK